MGFNINCKDCAYYRKGLYDDLDYCVHPKMIYFLGEPPIIDIEKNTDCAYYDGKN